MKRNEETFKSNLNRGLTTPRNNTMLNCDQAYQYHSEFFKNIFVVNVSCVKYSTGNYGLRVILTNDFRPKRIAINMLDGVFALQDKLYKKAKEKGLIE